MEEYVNAAKELIECIKSTTSAPLACGYFKEYFRQKGFRKLDCDKEFGRLQPGKYYTDLYGNTVVAFTIPENITRELRIVSAHTDSPALCIKPVPEIKSEDAVKFNVEVYGGPILNTWLDRPLGISGRVALRSNIPGQFNERLVDFKKPMLTIPNLAIHMNRDVNKGMELNRQTDMLPLAAVFGDISLNKMLAQELDVEEQEILDYDLYVYNCEDGCVLGQFEDMISAPRLDNITSSYAAAKAVTEAYGNTGINMTVLFDNEEIGSRTKQGAGSNAVEYLLRRIYGSIGIDNVELAVSSGKMLSVDVAHAAHPNHGEKGDVTNKVALGKGVVIKKSCSQGYATDCRMTAYVKELCESAFIPCQMYVNRSDIQGGSTLGSIMSSMLPMYTADIGVPVLAMHSARETMGTRDQLYLEKLLRRFFE